MESRKDSSRLQSQEAKKRRHEELQRQKQEEQLRKIQEREQKRQHAALIKEQVYNLYVVIILHSTIKLHNYRKNSHSAKSILLKFVILFTV